MKLAEFARWAIENGPFEGCDLDGASVQDMAVECGILAETEYDPERHGGSHYDAEPGAQWYVFTDEFLAAAKSQAPPTIG